MKTMDKLRARFPHREVTRKDIFGSSKIRRRGSDRSQQRWLQKNFRVVRPLEGVLLAPSDKLERVSYAKAMCRKADTYHRRLAYLDCLKVERVTSQRSLIYRNSLVKRFEYIARKGPSRAAPQRRRYPTRLKPGNKQNHGEKLHLAVVYCSGRVFTSTIFNVKSSSTLKPVLKDLNAQIRKAFPARKRLVVLQDNCPVQNSKQLALFWKHLKWGTNNASLEPTKKGRPKHMAAYSPDMSPMDGSLFGAFHRELAKKLRSRVPKTKRGFDQMAIRTMKSRKCIECAQKFVENFRGRYKKVIEAQGEIVA